MTLNHKPNYEYKSDDDYEHIHLQSKITNNKNNENRNKKFDHRRYDTSRIRL